MGVKLLCWFYIDILYRQFRKRKTPILFPTHWMTQQAWCVQRLPATSVTAETPLVCVRSAVTLECVMKIRAMVDHNRSWFIGSFQNFNIISSILHPAHCAHLLTPDSLESPRRNKTFQGQRAFSYLGSVTGNQLPFLCTAFLNNSSSCGNKSKNSCLPQGL